MRRHLIIPLSLSGALALGACSSDDKLDVTVDNADCENINPNHCLMPWPSSRYLADDAAMPTGRHIELPAASMPANQWGEQVEVDSYRRYDGFSPMTSMITVFAGQIDDSNLPAENQLPDSLLPTSPTVLLDAVTGERVGHFSELNKWDGTDLERQAFYVRPAVRLKENHRYIVAIRDLKKVDGSAVAPSDYFRALRDNLSTELAELEARRPLFEDIFGKLEGAGIDRKTLIEAWDFHTASGQAGWQDLLHMRDDANTRVGTGGVGCTVTKIEEDYGNAEIFRRVHGTFTVPLYVENDQTGARLVRGADGKPMFNGMAEAPFQVTIPYSVKTRIEGGGTGARLLTYGHGLMGERHEVHSSAQRKFMDRFEIVGLATDWWGMSEPDVNTVAAALGQLGDFPKVAERLTQGMLNTLLVTRTIAGACASNAAFQINGQTVFDPTEKYFLGISQGSIFGTTVAALSQDIDRFILNVGGMSYPIMIIRSVDFPDYNKVIQAWYPHKLDTDLLMVMIASHWDLSEPATYAPHIIKDPLPNTPVKKVLYTIGRYDAQVPNISSDIAARTMGLKALRPAVYEPWQVEMVDAPTDSAYVIYDVGAAPVPLGSQAAAEDNVAHGGVRRNEAAQLQMDAFMAKDGTIRHFCNGPCDPD